MPEIVITEKDVMIAINQNNAVLIDVMGRAKNAIVDTVTNLHSIVTINEANQVNVNNAIVNLIDNSPTAEQKTQLSALLNLYTSSLDATNTTSRLMGNMLSTITSISSSVSKSGSQLVMQSAIDMPVLP